MKRARLLLALLVCAAPRFAGAQVSPLQVGLQGGASIATLVGSDVDGADSRTSPYFGAIVVFHKSGFPVGFETGLSYVPKGATTSFDGAKYTLKINYVEIPLLVRLGLPLQGSRAMPVISLGGSVGIKTGCKLSGQSGSVSAEIDCSDSALEGDFDLKTLDLGISAGAAFDLPVGQRLILAPSVRYTRGLAVIGDTSDNADARNSVVQIGVSLRVRN